ncbi:hypothetical protein BSKO_13249 [Bryopsis sp. KO-2023]|nr:hypothetical protein BSKO_13249 [Bryopsis sp. KO-2023]
MFPGELPDDVLAYVFEMLPPATLLEVFRVSRRFLALACSDSVWRRKFDEFFDEGDAAKESGLKWVDVFRNRCELTHPDVPLQTRLERVSRMLDANEGKNVTFLRKNSILKSLVVESESMPAIEGSLPRLLSKYGEETGSASVKEEFDEMLSLFMMTNCPDDQYVHICGFLHDVTVGLHPVHEKNLPYVLARDPVAMSGKWEGFYVYAGSNHFDKMSLELKFDADGVMVGGGEDSCGPFTWRSETAVGDADVFAIRKDYDSWGWRYVGVLGSHSLYGYWGGRGGYFKIWKLKEQEA